MNLPSFGIRKRYLLQDILALKAHGLLFLSSLGAEIIGYSSDSPSTPNLLNNVTQQKSARQLKVTLQITIIYSTP